MPKKSPKPKRLPPAVSVYPQIVDLLSVLAKQELSVYLQLLMRAFHEGASMITPANGDFGDMSPRVVSDSIRRLAKHGLVTLHYKNHTQRTIEVV